jgi:hypothetical protein
VLGALDSWTHPELSRVGSHDKDAMRR